MRRDRIVIAERQRPVADDLAGLVALAGDQQRIAGLQRRNPGPDRLGAVTDIPGTFRSSQDGGADGFRLLAARIVVGDDDMIGILDRDRPHQRPLAGVAIAAGAEDDDELASGVGPQRLQRLRQRVRLVGVIDEDRRAVMFADALQPAFCTFEMFEACEHFVRRATGANGQACGDQGVLDLEFADQRKLDHMPPPAMFERELLRKTFDRCRLETNALAGPIGVAADRDDPQTALARRVDDLL